MATNSYISTEIKKILENSELEFPLNHMLSCAWIAAHFKADNLKVFNLKNHSSLCDYALLATVQNVTQAKSLADEMASQLKQSGANLVSYEGYDTADWILIDTGDIILHLFTGPSRELYDLDLIMSKQPQIKIPEDYYFGKPATVTYEKPELKGYF